MSKRVNAPLPPNVGNMLRDDISVEMVSLAVNYEPVAVEPVIERVEQRNDETSYGYNW